MKTRKKQSKNKWKENWNNDSSPKRHFGLESGKGFDHYEVYDLFEKQV